MRTPLRLVLPCARSREGRSRRPRQSRRPASLPSRLCLRPRQLPSPPSRRQRGMGSRARNGPTGASRRGARTSGPGVQEGPRGERLVLGSHRGTLCGRSSSGRGRPLSSSPSTPPERSHLPSPRRRLSHAPDRSSHPSSSPRSIPDVRSQLGAAFEREDVREWCGSGRGTRVLYAFGCGGIWWAGGQGQGRQGHVWIRRRHEPLEEGRWSRYQRGRRDER